MKNLMLIPILAILALASGCTANIRMTEINFESGGDMMVDASGAKNTTDTGQIAEADMTPLVEAAKDALKGKTTSLIDKVKDVLGDDSEADESEPVETEGIGDVVEVD